MGTRPMHHTASLRWALTGAAIDSPWVATVGLQVGVPSDVQ